MPYGIFFCMLLNVLYPRAQLTCLSCKNWPQLVDSFIIVKRALSYMADKLIKTKDNIISHYVLKCILVLININKPGNFLVFFCEEVGIDGMAVTGLASYQGDPGSIANAPGDEFQHGNGSSCRCASTT